MMTSLDNKKNPPAGKPETLISGGRKTATATSRPQEPAPKCPRCDSPNTKFCYYNNYNLSQPRHFCKTCRRYWTKGGALRNVPIGGGCRKNKKIKSSLSLSGDTKDLSGSSDIGGLKFLQGLPPAMDFHLNFPRLNYNNPPNNGLFNHFSSFGDVSNNCGSISSSPSNFSTLEGHSSSPAIGFNFPETGHFSNLSSSIESLSSINQDLHWKLQQQRLATLFVGDNQKGNDLIQSQTIEPIIQKPQPILFQNLEISKPGSCERKDGAIGSLATEWYFDNGFATVNPTVATSTSSNLHESASNWNGIQAWSDLTQYSSLP